MNKIHFILLSLVISILFLTGCKVQTVDEYNQQNEEETSVENSNGKIIPINEEKQDHSLKKSDEQKEQSKEKETETKFDTKKSDETKKNTTVNPRKDTQKNETKKELVSTNQTPKDLQTDTPEKNINTATQKNQNATKQKEKTPSKKEEKESKKDTISQKNPTNQPNKPTKDKETDKNVVKEKKKYVTISVRVDTLLKEENYKKLEEPLQNQKYVPKSGIIVATTKYQIINKDNTAWDITLRALKEHNVHFEYQGASETKYGSVYIEGINHLNEKDAGPLSGWMYSINGKNPGVGCSSYTVKDGDHITWQYTVDGKDIGL